ncbi:MAG: DUF1559 domain-containing protein [Planctomycetaceae bacterium]
MRFTTPFGFVSLCAVFLAVPPAVQTACAQGAAAAASIAPYLDEATIAVVAIDLERLDLDAISKAVTAGAGGETATVAATNAFLGYLSPVVTTLRDQGAATVYAVFSLHDVGRRMPYLIIPTSGADGAQKLAGLLSGQGGAAGSRSPIQFFPSAFVRDDVVIAGNEGLEQRLDSARVPDRGEGWGQALSVKSPAAVRIAVVPTEDQRRVLREILPAFPEAFGGLSGAHLADGLAWASLGVDLERAALQGVFEATDEESARVLSDGISKAISSGAAALAAMGRENPVAAAVGSLKTQVNGRRITLSSTLPDGAQKSTALLWLMGRLAPAARDVDARRSLKHLGLAMHNFHDMYGGFPPSASYDESGKPLLSWRVYLLPFLEESGLYGEFHLDEPWDSPHNRTLIERMPDVFASEHFDLNQEGKTTFLFPVGETTAFHGREGIAIRDITDGTSNTLMVLEVPHDRAVIWTRPDDFPVDQRDLMQALFGGRERFWTAFFDGSGRALTNTIPEDTLRKLFTHAGGEVIGEF